jgi:hypothetical protein
VMGHRHPHRPPVTLDELGCRTETGGAITAPDARRQAAQSFIGHAEQIVQRSPVHDLRSRVRLERRGNRRAANRHDGFLAPFAQCVATGI